MSRETQPTNGRLGTFDSIDELSDLFDDVPFEIQLLKIVEEVGEVADAHIGVLGSNPRKGVTHTMDDLRSELLDVALTSLIAYGRISGQFVLDALALHGDARLRRHYEQVGVPVVSPPVGEDA